MNQVQNLVVWVQLHLNQKRLFYQKKCGRATIGEKTVTTKLNVTVSAHVPVKVLRDYFGLTNTDLKPGIYSYGSHSIGKDFVFTADVMDEFEDLTKLIAFPKASNAGGFTINIDASQEELAMLELTSQLFRMPMANFTTKPSPLN